MCAARLSLVLSLTLLSALVTHAADTPAAEADDFPEIKARGVLRVLMAAPPDCGGLPRQMSPRDYELSLVTEAASDMGLEAVVVHVDKFEDIFPALLEGRGDVVADNIGANEERRKAMAFTMLERRLFDQIVVIAADAAVKSAADLRGRTVHIEKGTGYWRRMSALARKLGDITLATADDGVDTEELLHLVGTGVVGAAAADTNYTESFLLFRHDVKIIHTFEERDNTVWAVRPRSQQLLSALNKYLKRELPAHRQLAMRGDLPVIKKRGMLRVLTRNNHTSYFIHRGELVGYHYEMAKEFAKRNGLRLVMIVPPQWSDLIPWLLDGKGDLVATGCTVTDERLKIKGLAFCESYHGFRQMVVARDGAAAPKTIADLRGRTFVARRSSSYWETISKLRDSGVDVNLRAAPEELETYELIDKVGDGDYDLTLADEDVLNVELARRGDIVGAFPLTEPLKSAWMVRASDVELKKAVDEFIGTGRRGEFQNVVFDKYFKCRVRILAHHKTFVRRGDGFFFSDYDELIRRHASDHDVPWCLVAAQIYQESRFNASCVSWLGAAGLMQVMPATAAELGFRTFQNPDANIHAGVEYMRKLLKRFEENVAEEDRYCFALASYNGGYGHVVDARKLARELGLDPDRWERNVEKALELLAKPQYSSRAKYGFCRGDEVAAYVRDIMLRYKTYQQDVAGAK